jgi:cytoskeletal protein RodZ
MAESVGRKLQEARLARKLEIEDVAETTKIRPERIIDLEADEYSLFPNSTYAKSFLAKYANFLGVNIQNELDRFHVERTISLGAYQYLTPPPRPKHSFEPRRIAPRGFRVPPVVVAILLLIVLVGVPLFSYLALNVPRVVGTKLTDEKVGESERSRSGPPKTVTAQQSGALPSQSKPPASEENPAITSKNPKQDEDPKDESTPASSPLQARVEDGVEVRKALPASVPQFSSTVDSSARTVVPTFPDKKLEVRILKRTYVKVTKDQEGAQPVFEGFAGPESRPIVVAGKRFWVHVLDKGAVEVRKDGELVPSNSGDIVID